MNGISRIYTEDVNRDSITAILDSAVNGYTLIPALGSYKGIRERTLIIEIIGIGPLELSAIARHIGTENNQQTVILGLPSGYTRVIKTGEHHTVNGLVVDADDVEAEEF